MANRFAVVRKDVYTRMKEIGWSNTSDKVLQLHIENLRNAIYDGNDEGDYDTCDMLVDDFGFVLDFLEQLLK